MHVTKSEAWAEIEKQLQTAFENLSAYSEDPVVVTLSPQYFITGIHSLEGEDYNLVERFSAVVDDAIVHLSTHDQGDESAYFLNMISEPTTSARQMGAAFRNLAVYAAGDMNMDFDSISMEIDVDIKSVPNLTFHNRGVTRLWTAPEPEIIAPGM